VGGEVIGGRYRLGERLGHGAMSEVWLAEDEKLERPVALKLLAPHADRRRFEREARAAAALSDAHVERIYAYGESEGRPYMALEYLPGGSLEERLSYGKPLADAETASIAAQLASGLAHAHAHGLVHRDLKPANVLFDAEGRAKIADFGIARIVGGDTLTEDGTVLGTAGYISPEQAAGLPASPASDVYSFGVILYRLLTGRLPFEGESSLEVAAMHRDREPPPIETLRRDVPPNLAAVAAAAMAKEPRRRPPDGAALLAAPGGAEPSAEETVVLPGRRTPRPSRGRRLAALLAGLLLLAGGGVAAAILTHGQRSGGSKTSPGTRAHPRRTTSQATTVAPPPASTTTQSTTRPATTRTTPTTTPTTTAPTTTTTPPTTTPPTTTAPPTTTTLPVPP
jgi:serine/threonine protein kinase